MKRLITIIAIAISFTASSQQIETFAVYPEMNDFALYEPAGYDPINSTDIPLVMFLHGRSMSQGYSGSYSLYGPMIAIYNGIAIMEGQKFLILEPSAIVTEGWSSAKLHKVYEFVKAHYAFDHDRFYVIGMSMGGWGTLNYVNKYPDEVAACVGLCGGCDAKTPCGLNKVPTWIIHAIEDETTPISCSDRVVEAMKACGSTSLLKYSRLKDSGHDLTRFFNYWNLYNWLLKHDRTNRKIDNTVDFVNDPQYRIDPDIYLHLAFAKEFDFPIEITPEELEKIKARTPKQKGSNTTTSNSGTTTSSNSTGNSGNPSSTTKPTSSTKPVSSSSSNTSSSSKPTTTNKPTSTSKPANTVTIKPRNTTSTAKPGTATVRPVTSSNKDIYIVKQGDTLKKIAKKHKIKYKKLLQINHFTKDRKIKVGDKIKIA